MLDLTYDRHSATAAAAVRHGDRDRDTDTYRLDDNLNRCQLPVARCRPNLIRSYAIDTLDTDNVIERPHRVSRFRLPIAYGVGLRFGFGFGYALSGRDTTNMAAAWPIATVWGASRHRVTATFAFASQVPHTVVKRRKNGTTR